MINRIPQLILGALILSIVIINLPARATTTATSTATSTATTTEEEMIIPLVPSTTLPPTELLTPEKPAVILPTINRSSYLALVAQNEYPTSGYHYGPYTIPNTIALSLLTVASILGLSGIFAIHGAPAWRFRVPIRAGLKNRTSVIS